MSGKSAILLLAHGTPDTLDEIPEYLKNVTGGRPLPDSVIEEIRHRYSLIGTSPLTLLTREQGELLSRQLGLPVYIGMRNWKPYIADAIRAMRADGVTKFAAICLAPQNSRTSVGLYKRAVTSEATGMQIDFTEGWADHPLLADAFAERLRAVYTPGTTVVFTAHSVPMRTLQATADSPGDPYADEAKRTAALVAGRVGLAPGEWFFAFQSQGMSGGPGSNNMWIGPTVEDTLTALRDQDVTRVIIQPVGFLCDHVEILYDIDIGFRQHAATLGMEILRPESLNNSPLLIAALTDLAQQGLARLDQL
ncbi:MAG: ferrochelatase [Silvibacterium sp.]